MITVARDFTGMLINTPPVVLQKYYKNSTILLLLQKYNLSLKSDAGKRNRVSPISSGTNRNLPNYMSALAKSFPFEKTTKQ